MLEEPVQIWRNLLQFQVILFMAMRAANNVQVFARSLLRRKRRRAGMAAAEAGRPANHHSGRTSA